MDDVMKRLEKAVKTALNAMRGLARSLHEDADKLRALATRCDQADIKRELTSMATEFDAGADQIIRDLGSEDV